MRVYDEDFGRALDVHHVLDDGKPTEQIEIVMIADFDWLRLNRAQVRQLRLALQRFERTGSTER